MEPHERGSILVSAIFEAFISIYKSRVADLLRIASNGSGILPQGNLHPDLVNRLAEEAAKSAGHVLSMCIRALDYCPPVDITFGDYLRGIITADIDLVADDEHNYRLAFIDAFRKRGIYPQGLKTLSVESLQYTEEPNLSAEVQSIFNGISDFLREYRNEVIYKSDREEIFNISKKYIQNKKTDSNIVMSLHNRIFLLDNSQEFEKLTGIIFSRNWTSFGVRTSNYYLNNQEGPSIQIQNLRLVDRVGPGGKQINQIVMSLIQRCGVIMKDGICCGSFVPTNDSSNKPENGYEFRGGCTLIFDLDTLCLKYAISKPLIDIEKWDNDPQIDKTRMEKQYNYQNDSESLRANEFQSYFNMGYNLPISEPFALLHQS